MERPLTALLRSATTGAVIVTIAACSPQAPDVAADNATIGPRRESPAHRLSQQELALRIGPRCAETTAIAYAAAADGGATYTVACGSERFSVIVARGGTSTVTPLPPERTK